MISSLAPVGERARGQRWWLTTVGYLVGATAGGAAVGGLLGAVSVAVRSRLDDTAALAVLAVVAAVGLALDVTAAPVPSLRRQVDERWLHRYRGWVYGLGFGLQLGAAVTTIVTSSATWVVLAAAALSGGVGSGVLIGAAFGLARAAPLLATRTTTTAARLRQQFVVLTRLAGPVDRVTRVVQGVVAAAALAVVLGEVV